MKKRTNLEITKSIVESSRYCSIIGLDIKKLISENLEIDKNIKEIIDMGYGQYNIKGEKWIMANFKKPYLLGIERSIKEAIQTLRTYRDNLEY